MKRDWALVRQIAFQIEASTDGLPGKGIDSETIKIDGYTPEQIAYHCDLMSEQGLFAGFSTSHAHSTYVKFRIRRLTSAGHDFIDAARNDTTWKKATDFITTKATGVTLDVLLAYLKKQAKVLLGMDDA